MTNENISFGELILKLRKDNQWTVKDLIDKLEAKGRTKSLSPAYITRIEQYGEIPSPDLICRMAEVFRYDEKKLLDCARKIKVQKFDQNLQDKYDKAVGFYRTQKNKK